MALVAGLVTVPAGVAAAAAPPVPYQLENGVTKPIYSYENAIREHVWVKSTLDSDQDGKPDMIAVDIVRPSETDAAGAKVPVIMDASPYYQSTGRGNESQIKLYNPDGTLKQFPLFYDNYFVPRGYAIVQPDIAGTNKSTGCGDVGGVAEIGSVVAVIDWLNGRAQAYTDIDATSAPVVASWHNGKTGMIGKSWDGTLANGTAATGVDGLTTIVPISGIDSWYNYHRYNGARFTSTSPVQLHTLVSRYTASNTPCTAVKAALTAGNSVDGNYTPFWAERDYTKDAANFKASVFLIHGMGDMNVKPTNMDRLWAALAANDVPRKVWVHQYGHVDPFDFDRAEWVSTLHRWFDYWLQGVQNGIMSEPQARIQTAPDAWETATSWPIPQSAPQVLRLTPGATPTDVGSLTITNPGDVTATFNALSRTESQMTATMGVQGANRLIFLSPVLDKPLRLSGSPHVDLKVSADKADANLTFLLVDLGSDTYVSSRTTGEGIKTLTDRDCWGDSTATDSACYKQTQTVTTTPTTWILSRGWMNAAHHQSLETNTPLTPGEPVAVSWNAMPQDWTVKAGHQLAVIIAGNDGNYTSNVPSTPNVTVYLGESSVTLPIAGHPVDAWIPDGTGYQTIQATATGGALTMSSGSAPVVMPAVTITGLDQLVDGVLNRTSVLDGRGTAAGWDLTGQVSDFTGPGGTILADNLGWAPRASVVSGSLPSWPQWAANVLGGPQADPGTGTGLATSQTLCRAPAGHSAGSFGCDAALRLGIPGSTPAGTYTAVLTLTLI